MVVGLGEEDKKSDRSIGGYIPFYLMEEEQEDTKTAMQYVIKLSKKLFALFFNKVNPSRRYYNVETTFHRTFRLSFGCEIVLSRVFLLGCRLQRTTKKMLLKQTGMVGEGQMKISLYLI